MQAAAEQDAGVRGPAQRRHWMRDLDRRARALLDELPAPPVVATWYAGHRLRAWAHLGTLLKRLGICPRPGRTSALMNLSTQLPAVILTELLGISPETATAWTQAGGSWARYAALLPDRPNRRT